jgi:AcrR family transcriptional regulator
MTSAGEAKGGDTKERIEKEALRLFSQKGYDATGMRDIAKAVGIGQGAIYNHFKSKQEILERLVETLMDSAIVKMFSDKDAREVYRGGKKVLEDIVETFSSLGLNSQSEALFRLLMQELYRKENIRELYYEHFYQSNVKKLSVIFFMMMQEEMIKSSDPLMLANEFFAPLFFYQSQIILLKIDGKSTSAAGMLFEKHVDIFWSCIKMR